MSVEAIIALAILTAMLAAALVITSIYEDAGLDGANRATAVLLIMTIFVPIFPIFLAIQTELSDIPSGTYSVADTELAYSPGSIDPTDVTVDGKNASVDAIQVDTSLKEPLIVVKEDRVTLILPSRDYFASQTNR